MCTKAEGKVRKAVQVVIFLYLGQIFATDDQNITNTYKYNKLI
jgi:hypothetical protein